METRVVQVGIRGTLTLPIEFRERYGLKDGDAITILDLGDVILLIPRVGVIPTLVSQIETLLTEANLTVDDLVAGTGKEGEP